MDIFKTEIGELKYVGSKTKALFGKLGIWSVRDLVYHFPRRYIDLSKIKSINEVKIGEEVSILGTVVKSNHFRKGKNSIITVTLTDRGSFISAVWFNQEYILKSLARDVEAVISGTVSFKYGKLQIENPVYEILSDEKTFDDLIHTARIVPVYPSTAGLTSRYIRMITNNLLKDIHINDVLEKFKPENLLPLDKAIKQGHFPNNFKELAQARKRIVWDEIFLNQMMFHMRRKQRYASSGTSHISKNNNNLDKIIKTLPFELTEAQNNAVREIIEDMQSQAQMERLLQGDVGSGKTAVAMVAMAFANSCGNQAALMVPTELLARQHFTNYKSFFEKLGFRVDLLIGGMTPAEKKSVQDEIGKGAINTIIGTHSLIQEKVKFKNLSLVVIDEQHRFGVGQRKLLQKKGTPDILTMTATPIPRTLSLVRYGDLDISNLKTMPAGRKTVETIIKSSKEIADVAEKVKERVSKGQQAFIVCPLIDTGKVDLLSVKTEIGKWRKMLYPYRIAEVHGKTGKDDREKIMSDFSKGFIDVLISTTIIEVGIDIPNATIMVVNNAERYGLAQLHQLRGRIGRGKHESLCILLFDKQRDGTAFERLSSLAENNDGFSLSETDMQLRGEGEAFGMKQWGRSGFKFAKFPKHENILKQVNEYMIENSDRINIDNGIRQELLARYPSMKEFVDRLCE